ncbi:MAG TPA: c-type cytochrome [Thermoanaerobaculia bacterium]|nr:c-type cytochrome [Thermoanaerobaculia bacterium]
MKRLFALTLLLAAACNRSETPAAQSVPIGDAGHGLQIIRQYGCQTCHVIPGIEGGGGALGPSLEHIASRPRIAHRIALSPETLARYIANPPAVDPQTRMPPLGVSQPDARDVAAYLLTLK